MAAARVIVIYGSETGGSKSKISTIVANWQKRAEMKFSIKGMMEGNDAATKFDTLKDEYDVIILCTSSFGDGDPPSGYENFLGKLYKGAAAGEEGPKPLAGMQHAVLGFGSSMYDTFMNCPRLCDKYLGDCGSRRMVQRAELDEVDEAGGAGDECDQIDLPEYKRWSSDMLKVLIKLPAATKPPCCDWTVPADKIVEIDGAALSSFSSEGAAGPFLAVLAIGVAAGLYFSGSLDGFLGGDEAGEP